MALKLCAGCLQSFADEEVAEVDGQLFCTACRKQAENNVTQGEAAPETQESEKNLWDSPVDDDLPEKPKPRPKPFFTMLPGTFSYALGGKGYFIIILGGILLMIFDILAMFPLIGLFFAIISAGYVGAYMMKIIAQSSTGNEELPDFPEFSNFWDTLVEPFFQLLIISLIFFLPGSIYFRMTSKEPVDILITIVLLCVGMLFMPMSLVIVSLFKSLGAALNPLFILSSIFRVPAHYFVACLVVLCIFVSSLVCQYFIKQVSVYLAFLVNGIIAVYFLTVEMRILGLIYYCNQDQLGWFRMETEPLADNELL